MLISFSLGAYPSNSPSLLVGTLAATLYLCSYLPEELRNIIQAESALNDGAAYPHVSLAVLLLNHDLSMGQAIARWFYRGWAYDVRQVMGWCSQQ
jgi:NhaP-type Na+/H+ or K+/H+ antiporter